MPVSDNGPLGVYDPNSVRDRIRQWQSQGGGVVAAHDVALEDNGCMLQRGKEHRSTRKNERQPSSHKEANEPLTPPRIGRAAAEAGDATSLRTRSKSTPTKRVISDQHWRKKQNPPNSVGSSKATEKPRSRYRVPDDNLQTKSGSELEPEEKRRCASARTTPLKHASGEKNDLFLRDMIRSEPRTRSKRATRRQSEDTEPAAADEIDAEDTGISLKEDFEKKSTLEPASISTRKASWTSKPSSRKRRSSLQKEEELEDVKTKAMCLEGKVNHQSHKSNILNKLSRKQTSESVVTPRIPSIEQWLHETPDPFVDSEETSMPENVPLRSSSHKRPAALKSSIVEDPNQIWNALNTREGMERSSSGSRRRKRIPSSAIYEADPFPLDFDMEPGLSSPAPGLQTERAPKLVDLVKESPPQAPSSLTRRGANKSVTSPLSDRRRSRKEKTNINNKTVAVVISQSKASPVEQPKFVTPLQPPGLGRQRPFPPTDGRMLSTIASVETFNTRSEAVVSSVANLSEQSGRPMTIDEKSITGAGRDYRDLNSLLRKNSRLTKHADLMSILSLPKGDSKSIQSARSIRTSRSRLATATTGDIMQELATDETKYMRELRTLVDGVIPVLLSCVLSRSDSAVAAGLFRPSTTVNEDPNFTKPIVDMGIALERLKTMHKRMPTDPNGFLTWAQGAQRVYIEYLKSWRMGFQDVVVNLAPAIGPTNDIDLEEGLPRNAEGDVLNGDGERVDVAFLLKRPLVRLKYLTKTLKGLHFIQKSSKAELLMTQYQKLVDDARQRSDEERARLEDEAAANLDTTRARDLQTLAPLAGVVMDRTRRVRARDHFNLALQHSSGQRIDCRVELLLRDEASREEASGDVLICEVDGTGRWLLFPPVQLDAVSARNGDLEGEVIIMIRGKSSNGSQWQECFALISEDENAGFEWVQMLGLIPVPPQISRSRSFVIQNQKSKPLCDPIVPRQITPSCDPVSPGIYMAPSPREVEVPIGETPQNAPQAIADHTVPNHDNNPSFASLKDQAEGQSKSQYDSPNSPSTPVRISTNYVDQASELRSSPSHQGIREPGSLEPAKMPRSFKEALGLSGSSNAMGLKRTSAKRLSKLDEANLRNRRSPTSSPTNSELENWDDEAPLNHEHQSSSRAKENTRRPRPRSLSSTPSMDLPHIPKARKNSPPITPLAHKEEELVWPTSSMKNLPTPTNKLTKKRPSLSHSGSPPGATSTVLDTVNRPVFEKGCPKQRRSSSPLKHEYDPSTASDTLSDSDTSTVERNVESSVSDESSDEELEDGDAPTPLLPFAALKGITKLSAKPPLHACTSGSIKPSDSASQAPYKTVPAQPAMVCKAIASIFTWLDAGRWEQLHPDECSIVISPGLIEAFEMSAAHSHMGTPLSSPAHIIDTDKTSDVASATTSQNNDVQGDRPLVALELTPLVPLRRGTALDISIRSPPTPQSQIASSKNIMFRSRNPEECEALYALINHSRIYNPTFIALQNARGPTLPGGLMIGSGGHRPGSRAGSNRTSWFGGWGRSPSYRASSRRTPSLAPSESSIGSMSSAFSALKRFSARSNGIFNIAQSTIGSRVGSRAGSVYTSSDNSSGSGTSSPIPPGMMADVRKDAPIGLTEAKIRLYIRETASKWRDMGSARLTIKRAEVKVLGPDGRPMSSSGVDRQLGHERRIIVNGKTKGEILLDVQLGESCFERVARTGIAVSVWEDIVGPNGEVGVVNAVGGVSGGKAKVYMIQLRSEAETAYTFSLVGRLRY